MNQEESPLPGARLRQVREERGLSRRDVARELHLSTTFLTSLEEDDYDRLPEPPFVKGYLRNYARLLGLSGEELAGAYQQRLDEDRRHRREEEAVAAPNPRPPEWRLPALVVLGVILVIAVGWWLWPGQSSAPASDAAPDAGPGVEQSGDSMPESAAPDALQPDSAGPLAPTGQASGDAGETLNAAPLDNQASDGDAGAAGAGTDTGAAGARLEPGQTPGESPAGGAGLEPAPEPAAAPAPTVDRIAMEFSRVCWIKIVDAKGHTLSQGRQDAGSRVDVEGEAPFQVTIGDAAAVSSVSINDAPARLPSHRSGDVVRVTLP